jgi:hypothetical protein
MKHLNYETASFKLNVEVQDVLSQSDKDLIAVLFKSLIDTEEEVKPTRTYGKTMIDEKDVRQQVLRTLIDKNSEVSCKDGSCRVPREVNEIPPNLLLKSSKTYKNAHQKLYYILKKKNND